MNEFLRYIENVLDAALSNDASTIKQSYKVKVEEDVPGILFIPRFPTNLILNTETYYKIYDIISPAVYPKYTCVRPSSVQIVEVANETISTARGFFYPWKKGKSKRLVGKLDDILVKYDLQKEIPLMDGISVGRNATSYIVSGNTGAGKSVAIQYLIRTLERTTNRSRTKKARVIVIDPKKSDGARYAKRHPEIELVVPDIDDRPEDFLVKVTEKIANIVHELYRRQELLYQNSTRISTDANEIDVVPIWLFIEEMGAITLGLSPNSRQVKDFFEELELIALLGREALIGFVLTSQIARNDVIPIPIRSQANVRILLGRIDKSTVQYLFPSMTEGLSIPISGKGTGIVEINDGRHFGAEPIAMPTIVED